MNTAGIKPGDIVDIDKRGRRFLALIVRRDEQNGKLRCFDIEPVTTPRVTYKTATAREVVGHYRKAKGSA